MMIVAALRNGVRVVRGRFGALLRVGLLPALILVGSVACEWLLRTADLPIVNETTRSTLLQLLVQALRLFGVGMLLAAWTWYCGAALIEETPSVSEAVQTGWRAAIRSALAAIPIWLVLLMGALLAVISAQAMRLAFAPAGIGAVTVCIVTVVSVAALPFVVVLTKFALLIPVTVFEDSPPFDALRMSVRYMPWRLLALHWWPVASLGVTLLIGVVVPLFLLTNNVWALSPGTLHPGLDAIRQLTAVGLLWLLGGVAPALAVALYLSQRPDLFSSQPEETDDCNCA